jgi:hypothetical protein
MIREEAKLNSVSKEAVEMIIESSQDVRDPEEDKKVKEPLKKASIFGRFAIPSFFP